MVTRRR